ncbi:phage integrase [Rhodocyclaceae bacterium SMB388]
MQITIGNVLRMSVRRTYLRQGRYYYQRSVPSDLRDKYPSKLLKLNLETSDPQTAARKVTELDRRYEAEWSILRGNPEASPKATRVHAERLLADHGIDPKAPDEDALTIFFNRLDGKREAYAAIARDGYAGDEGVYRDAEITEYLSPVESVAVELLDKSGKDRLSDVLRFYLETHHKGNSPSVEKASNVAMNGLITAVGDKHFDKLNRGDGRTYITTELARGVTTGTVRRRLKSLNAIVNAYIKEKELDRRNPLSGLKIAGEGEDTTERQPFNAEELKTLQTTCKKADDDIRWLVALLSDTGARLAEIAGLAIDDLVLDDPIPHVVIKPHPWRSLKSKESTRKIPLVGASLWAANRVKEAGKGTVHAFPRYIKHGLCTAESASASIATWIRSKGMNHTAHDLRHSLRDRLREVQCPEEIIDAVGGWALQSVGQGYGQGYSLRVMKEWLDKIVAEGAVSPL